MQLYQLLFPNGKKYIGITSKTALERFRGHCKPSANKTQPVQLAIKKYGKENVIITVLAALDNWELLCLAEQEAIEKFNTFKPNGYNLTLGGEGTLGKKMTERTKSILATRNKNRTQEELKNLSEKAKNRKDGIIERLADMKRGIPLSEEHKKKLSNATFGVARNKEFCNKQKKAWETRERAMSKEAKNKMKIAWVSRKSKILEKKIEKLQLTQHDIFGYNRCTQPT